jgi:PadR family transcriptional regulator PadR
MGYPDARAWDLTFPTCSLICKQWTCSHPRCQGMPAEKNDLHRGTLDMLILKILVGGALHGYAIAQRLQQVSKDYFQVPQGSLYPALHRLEERDWLDAEWKDTDTGREAKFYTLTKKGRKQLEAEVLGWERLSDAVSLILRTAD